MNRAERRAAKSRARDAKLDRVVAIHEAGHAVGRILTAKDFGIADEQAVAHIQIGAATPMGGSLDGLADFVSQAVTYGPTLSVQLQSIFSEITSDIPRERLNPSFISDAIKIAEARGIDVSNWLRARMLIATFGAAAEARFQNQSLGLVWNAYEAESDLRCAVADGRNAGLSTSEIESFIDEALNLAGALVERADVWEAIKAIADVMPNIGKANGSRVATIAARYLQTA